MTILDWCISLKMIKKFLVVLGVVDMRQLLLNLDGINVWIYLFLRYPGNHYYYCRNKLYLIMITYFLFILYFAASQSNGGSVGLWVLVGAYTLSGVWTHPKLVTGVFL